MQFKIGDNVQVKFSEIHETPNSYLGMSGIIKKIAEEIIIIKDGSGKEYLCFQEELTIVKSKLWSYGI